MWVERVEICGLPRSSERAHGSLHFPLLDLEPLLDLSGWRDDGSAGLGSRVIRMHTYTSTSILISNSIIHPEIENPSYPYHPTRRTESYSPRIYLSPGCLPPGFLCQFMSDPMGNLPPSQGSWAKWTVCILWFFIFWHSYHCSLNWLSDLCTCVWFLCWLSVVSRKEGQKFIGQVQRPFPLFHLRSFYAFGCSFDFI